MDDNIVVCNNCGAKLRLKPAAMKVMKEVKCGKCRKSISLSPEANAPAPAPTPPPAAGATAAAPDVPPLSITPSPHTSPTPSAAPTAPVKIPTEGPAAPQPSPAPVPVQPNRTEHTSGAATPTGTTPNHAGLEDRLKKLEATVTGLQNVIRDLCRLELDTGRKSLGDIEKLVGRL